MQYFCDAVGYSGNHACGRLSFKTGSNSSATKGLAIGGNVTGSWGKTTIHGSLCHSSCGLLKKPHCSMAMNGEHGSSSTVMLTSLYELQILVWDESPSPPPQQKTQTLPCNIRSIAGINSNMYKK